MLRQRGGAARTGEAGAANERHPDRDVESAKRSGLLISSHGAAGPAAGLLRRDERAPPLSFHILIREQTRRRGRAGRRPGGVGRDRNVEVFSLLLTEQFVPVGGKKRHLVKSPSASPRAPLTAWPLDNHSSLQSKRHFVMAPCA
ncbi:hypothetical protein JZ751_028412 [Albula glossodonta]|uniref:Uncharacterized protein n=1 Tax=Albula glossodonta TaxID=121402 RepID=A0A8T2NJ14_9TELE|nr:hypothetical protein JZ751_028412 [Albula glossodonta]